MSQEKVRIHMKYFWTLWIREEDGSKHLMGLFSSWQKAKAFRDWREYAKDEAWWEKEELNPSKHTFAEIITKTCRIRSRQLKKAVLANNPLYKLTKETKIKKKRNKKRAR